MHIFNVRVYFHKGFMFMSLIFWGSIDHVFQIVVCNSFISGLWDQLHGAQQAFKKEVKWNRKEENSKLLLCTTQSRGKDCFVKLSLIWNIILTVSCWAKSCEKLWDKQKANKKELNELEWKFAVYFLLGVIMWLVLH